MGEGECDHVEPLKKGRHRKKQLFNSILQQMEFYFGDSNLSKDRFLSQLINRDSCRFLNYKLKKKMLKFATIKLKLCIYFRCGFKCVFEF